MKYKILFILTIIIISTIPNVNGFKEFIDDFSNDNFIQSKNNLIYNETTKSVYLQSDGVITNYDFTTFTEVDEGNCETYNSSFITITNYDRTKNLHLYKDMGIDAIGDFIYNIDMMMVSSDSASNYIWFVVVANQVGDYQEVTNLQGLAIRHNVGTRYLMLYDKGGGAGDSMIISLNVWYYITFSRIGSTLNVYVYSDSSRLTLIDTLTQAGAQTTAWRYLYGSMGFDYSSGNNVISAKIRNLKGGGGYRSNGVLYTKDIMQNFTGYTHSLLYNYTNGLIKISYSNDNSTWVNHYDVGGYDIFNSLNAVNLITLNYLSPLYLKIELFRSGISETPIFYGYRLMVTDAEANINYITPEIIKPNSFLVFAFPSMIIVIIFAIIYTRRK